MGKCAAELMALFIIVAMMVRVVMWMAIVAVL